MSEVKWDAVEELIEGIEKLMDAIEDVEKWNEFAERIDRARNGQIGDPVELMSILTDLLEYLAGKVDMGPLGQLIKRLLEVAIGALEAGASLVRWILLFRYRRRRAAGDSPVDAAKRVTHDRAARVWLRLKEQMDKKGENDPEEVREDETADVRDAIPMPTFPRKPSKPWSKEHDKCCSTGKNATTPPTVRETISSSSRRINGDLDEYEVVVEFDFTHPCGIASNEVKAFTRRWPGAGEPDPKWIEVPRSSTGSSEQQFKLQRSSITNGKKGKATVKSAGDMKLIYRVISNCGTSITRYARVIS